MSLECLRARRRSNPSAIKDLLPGKRIATSFPNVTRQFLSEHGIEAHLVLLTGSVEVMIALGVADAIVDLVETGSTLAAKLDSRCFIRILGSMKRCWFRTIHTESTELCGSTVKRIEGARCRDRSLELSLLEYNVPRDRLAEADAATPGFNLAHRQSARGRHAFSK
ncbi:MAG: ATP phosphoribosyltransferase [Pirellulaceae bacterium]